MKAKTRHPVIKTLIALLLILAALTADSKLRLVTDGYTAASTRLPESFDGFRIVQLSDLHGAVFGKNNSRLIDAVAAAKPDIIAITGDMADERTELSVIDSLLAALTELAPVYYVSGNHEWAAGRIGELTGIFEKRGVTYLRNDYVLLTRGEESIVLAGVEDPNSFSDMITPDELMEGIRQREGEKYTVLLAHRNNWAELYPELEADLILCGHAHGGIVRLPFLGGVIGSGFRLFPEHVDGQYSVGRYELIISRGLGNSVPVPRFLNNPEIVAVTLKKSE